MKKEIQDIIHNEGVVEDKQFYTQFSLPLPSVGTIAEKLELLLISKKYNKDKTIKRLIKIIDSQESNRSKDFKYSQEELYSRINNIRKLPWYKRLFNMF